MTNKLYFGDNLKVLRDEIASGSVDLIYLDPPFNSNATYNVLFRSPTGEAAESQIEAFEDSWHWTTHPGGSEYAFDEVIRSGNSDAAELLRAMRAFLGDNDMMAYLAMMAVRLLELHRVLKPTGSLYLHCDPTASHYLKLLLDAVFGGENYRNEIIWKRTSAHSNASRRQIQFTTLFSFIQKQIGTSGIKHLHPTPKRTSMSISSTKTRTDAVSVVLTWSIRLCVPISDTIIWRATGGSIDLIRMAGRYQSK